VARHGKAWLSKARKGVAKKFKSSCGNARLGKARKGKAWLGKARRG
jgi:hypothetical protein